ncbi:2617_t:CDS:1 [Funneliformis caledonium]|uniref:2617_t:CDS:1 n=1 Tax=Funneliformis caledonium TaxID=1117310 RepID=A0A9N9AJR5_9GLOM|nr:2617_t:CDS:1 [Funneliformis caledonium]
MLENVIRPKFPPTLTTDVILERLRKSNKPTANINSFIAYRMELQDEYHRNNKKLRLPIMSSIASVSWKREPPQIKAFYKQLADDAKSLYKPKYLPVVEYKHKEKIENDQESGRVLPTGVICDADSDDVDQTVVDQNSTSGLLIEGSPKFYEHSGTRSAETSSTADPNYNEMNLIASYQRHICLLEQMNKNLFDLLKSTQL